MQKRTVIALCAAGLMASSAIPTMADGLLFDFGADATQTVGGPAGPATTWNNVTSVATTDDGISDFFVSTNGTPTDIYVQMLSRFNGVNENGTLVSTVYPQSATRDSIFGNTELFSGLENITPIFSLYGLNPATTYSFTFYASRTGVSDNRETRYTVTGTTEAFADLNVANNVDTRVTVPNITPDASGGVMIALTPGPNNNNGNHFTYLGVLEIQPTGGEKILVDFGGGGSLTEVVEPTASASWNNITTTIGVDPAGALDNLVTTNGAQTPFGFRMVSRFNGSNANGTTASTNFPASATQDSLFGNTAAFNGLSDILPVFRLTGLQIDFAYTFTFFGSRTGVTDNRETRYEVTGANSGTALLNTANNTNNTVTVSNIRPNASGEITIALTAGPNNNNANRFTYLGVMKVDFAPVRTPRILIDFGGANRTENADDPLNTWNNVSTDVGSTDTGVLAGLVRTDGSATTINLQMESRFNGANENGTQLGVDAGAPYVIEATRDSLFGNTELFSGLENITPRFKLTGLNPSTDYTLNFYASRMGVGDNRETRYTVTGATEESVDLNAGNNELEVVTVASMRPTAAGEITIALFPGPNNDNGNHFTYMGVLQLDWQGGAAPSPSALSNPTYANGTLRFTLTGAVGKTYVIQRTTNFTSWETAQTVTLTQASQEVQVNTTGAAGYFRAVEQ